MTGASAEERLKSFLIGRVGGSLLTSSLRSCRFEVIEGFDFSPLGLAPGQATVYVLWHGRLLPGAFAYYGRGLGTLISQNRDGDYISGMIENWGYKVVRGSSSRGGSSAFRSLVRLLRKGTPIALTPDGPRGPRQKMKLGPLQVAQMAGVSVTPVSVGAVRGWYVGGWDRFLIPRPFTWIPLAFGPPVQVDSTASEAELAPVAAALEESLNRLTALVDDAAKARR